MVEFNPRYSASPGEVILDYLDFHGFSQKWLAERLGYTEKHICKIISGDASISADVAVRLSMVIGSTADFWLSMENSHKIYKARLAQEHQAELETESEVFEKIPYSDLAKMGWVKPSRKPVERVLNLYKFFNVSSLNLITKTQSIAFRKNSNKEYDYYAIAAWLQRGENIVKEKRNSNEYDSKKLKESLKDILEAVYEMTDDFFERVTNILSECGVILITTKYLKNTYINGATRWIGNNPVIQLSDRGKSDDIICFTLFHELGHVIKHSKKDQFLNIDDGYKNELEKEADLFASNTLLSDELFELFMAECMGNINKSKILRFSNSHKISPSILVGRLEHKQVVSYSRFSDMHKKVAILD